jgi:arginine repressor
VEFVYEYLHHTILPNLVREINGSSREELGEQKYQEVLKQRLICISISTVSRWMNLLGFKYEFQRTGYYVETSYY